MYSDAECDAAIIESRDSAHTAEKALCNYMRDQMRANLTFKRMYSNRKNYRAVDTNLLRHFYWLGGESGVTSTNGSSLDWGSVAGTSATVSNSAAACSTMTGSVTALMDLSAAIITAADATSVSPAQETADQALNLPVAPVSPSHLRKR